jgi:hypothetical protein
MGRARKPRSLNEALLAEGPREAETEAAAAREDRHQARARLTRLAMWVAGALFLLGLKWIVEFLPAWIQIVAGVLVVAHLLSIFLRSTKRRSVRAKGLRALFLAWLALSVVITILVAVGGFQNDDRALLGIVWPILALIWMGYRLRRAVPRARPETGSRPR